MVDRAPRLEGVAHGPEERAEVGDVVLVGLARPRGREILAELLQERLDRRMGPHLELARGEVTLNLLQFPEGDPLLGRAE